MDLLPFFEWCEQSAVASGVRSLPWIFPLVMAFHLMGFAVLGGAILLVDLRLLGFGLDRQPAGELARDVEPWVMGGLAVMITTGSLLFLSQAVMCYYNEPFWIKMYALAGGILFSFTVRRKVLRRADADLRPAVRRAVALASIALWATVAWGGRWIGFSS